MTNLPAALTSLLAPVNTPISLAVVIEMIEARGWVWRVGSTTFSKSHHQYRATISRIEAHDLTGDLEVHNAEHDGDTPQEALAWAFMDAHNARAGEAKA